jgi:hypothetical protein
MGAVEDERSAAIQASLLGVFAAQALLLAFSLKLRMSAALHQQDKAGSQPTSEWQCGFKCWIQP